jgi:hypothetical protein
MADNYLNPFGAGAFSPNAPQLDLGIDFSSQFQGGFPEYGRQVMAPSPVKPGQSFGELALGIGSIAEGIGNVVRSIKGMDPAPPGIATRSLTDFIGQNKDTTLERILDRLFSETQAKFEPKEREPSPEYRAQSAA